MKSIKLWI